LAGSTSLELEITSLHREGHGLDYVCQELFSKYDRTDAISFNEINGVFHFYQKAGRPDLALKLFANGVRRNKFGAIPIGLLADLLDSTPDYAVDDSDIQFFEMHAFQLIQVSNILEESILQSELFDRISLRTNRAKQDYKEQYQEKRKLQKSRLIEQLNKYRVYNLPEQEQNALKQLLQLYPQDVEVKLLQQAFLEKKADEILRRVQSRHVLKPNASDLYTKEDEATRAKFAASLTLLAARVKEESPDQMYNLAVLAFQLELFEPALHFINDCPKSASKEWLKAEILLEGKRYLDLLQHVESIEKEFLTDSDAVYGANYLKALAYHGLGQTNMGLQLLEQISAVHPNYRSTDALIIEWKTS